jgi:hypothetical protein
MRQMLRKFDPWLLVQSKKKIVYLCGLWFVKMCRNQWRFIKSLTGNEIWVSGYDPEINQQFLSLPQLKEVNQLHGKTKMIIVVFFDGEGVCTMNNAQQDWTIIASLYKWWNLSVFTLCHKWLQKWESCEWQISLWQWNYQLSPVCAEIFIWTQYSICETT